MEINNEPDKEFKVKFIEDAHWIQKWMNDSESFDQEIKKYKKETVLNNWNEKHNLKDMVIEIILAEQQKEKN